MKKAYIIDEEVLFSDLLGEILGDINLDPAQIWDASSALDIFTHTPPNIDDIFFVDVGLDIGFNHRDFDKIVTSASNTTGLRLVELIIERKILVREQLNRLTLYSSHITGPTWEKVLVFSKQHKIRAFKKNPLFKANDYHKIARELLRA